MSAAGVQWWCSAKGGIWTWHWRPYPGVWLFILAGAAGLALRWRRRLRVLPAAGGLLLLWIALDWPVGPLGAGYLETVHMVQFLLVVLLAPPLLLLAVPSGPTDLEGRSLARRALARPGVALLVSALLIVGGHVPPTVDTLMASQLGSLALDLAWLGAGFALWWPLLSPRAAERIAPGPLRILYLYAALLPAMGIAVWLLVADWPQYRLYELAPPVYGISALADQQMAGGLMGTAGILILLVASAVALHQLSRMEGDAAPSTPQPRAASVVAARFGGGSEPVPPDP